MTKIRLYSIVTIMVLTLAIPTVFLRGTLPQQTATEIDGLAQFASMQGVSLGPVIWSENFNNASTWAISSSTPAILQVNNSLMLKAVIPSKTTTQALSLYHNVSLPLDRGPIVTLVLQVSRGVSYGVRFWGVTANNRSFSAWHEGSTLQHRPGLGSTETLSVNLVSESSIPNQTLSLAGAKITQMALYMEAVPLTSGTFSMYVSDLQANSVLVTKASSNEISGNFTALVANLGPAIATQNLFQVFVGLDIKGSSDLSYVPYFTAGATVAAQGYTYVTKIATTYELALLSPVQVNSSPLFSGSVRSSSLVVSAKTGDINFFRLNSVSIRFFSTQSPRNASLEPATSRDLVYYYFIFLFVIPVAMVALIVKVFKDENER